MLAGRRDEGDALYAQLHDRYPHDVWLPNSAALTHLDLADWATALWWTDIALELTMNDDDRAQLIAQLSAMRTRALTALGRTGDDDLGRRVATYVAPPRTWTASPSESWGEVEGADLTYDSVARPSAARRLRSRPTRWIS